jgi:hypothetical protein
VVFLPQLVLQAYMIYKCCFLDQCMVYYVTSIPKLMLLGSYKLGVSHGG